MLISSFSTSDSARQTGSQSTIRCAKRLAAFTALLIGLMAPAVTAQDDGYWFRRPEMPIGRQEIYPGLCDGRIYIVGGYLANATITDMVDAYDPSDATWSSIAPYPFDIHHSGVASYDGILYSISGYTTMALPWALTDATMAYNPATDTWTERAPIPTPRGEAGAVTFGDNIYYIGGNDTGGDDVGTVEVYDPIADSWSTVSSMPTPRHHFALAVLDTLIYVVGGRQGYWGQGLTLVGAVEGYSPASDTWYTLADMLTMRSAPSAAAIDGKLYLFGGEIPGIYDDVDVYDPSTDSWHAIEPMLTPRHGTGAVKVADTVFIIGGSTEEGMGTTPANDGFVLGTCPDFDRDGYANAPGPTTTCPTDNCPTTYNPDQVDSDQDGYGDACDGCPDDPLKITAGLCGCGVSDVDSDGDMYPDCMDQCPGFDDTVDPDGDLVASGCDNCPDDANPDQLDSDFDGIGDVCDKCCVGRVGDANASGEDEPSIGDISTMVDAKFISGSCEGKIDCIEEADINQSGDLIPDCDDITIGDISALVDYLFITGPEAYGPLPDCL